MPLYDYECTECDFTLEITHSMVENPELCCPECGYDMKRKVATPSISVRSPKSIKPKRTGDPVIDRADDELARRIDKEL